MFSYFSMELFENVNCNSATPENTVSVSSLMAVIVSDIRGLAFSQKLFDCSWCFVLSLSGVESLR